MKLSTFKLLYVLLFMFLVVFFRSGIVQAADEEVKPYKEWTVKFNTEMDVKTLNQDNIYVTDQNDEVVTGIKIVTINSKKLKIVNSNGYTPGEKYKLIITSKVTSSEGIPLKKQVEKSFNVAKGLDDKYISTNNFKVVDNQIIFIESGKTITPKSTLNNQINNQLFRAMYSLLDEEKFTYLKYNEGFDIQGIKFPSRVFLRYANSYLAAEIGKKILDYTFYDQTPYNARNDWKIQSFSENVSITLTIQDLDTEGNRKLEESLKAIFPKQYSNIYNYIQSVHLTDTKQFGSIQVDHINNGADNHFMFTYVE